MARKPKENADVRARRALAEFRSIQPALTAYARNITGNRNVRVEASSASNGMTNGAKIMMRPPISLGDISLRKHSRGLCDVRDPETYQIKCETCAVREFILSITYHEISHIAFDSFAPMTEEELKRVRRVVKDLAPEWYAQRIEARFREVRVDDSVGRIQYNGLGRVINPYLGLLVGAMEDVRVDQRMIDARPGTEAMKRAKTYKAAIEGVEQTDAFTGELRAVPWSEYNPNHQAVLGCLLIAGGFNPEGWLVPSVVEVLRDKKLLAMLAQAPGTVTVAAVFVRSFEIFMRLREMGYFILEDEEPPPVEPEAPEPEEEDDDQSDESDPTDADADPEGDADEQGGSGEASDEDSDDAPSDSGAGADGADDSDEAGDDSSGGGGGEDDVDPRDGDGSGGDEGSPGDVGDDTGGVGADEGDASSADEAPSSADASGEGGAPAEGDPEGPGSGDEPGDQLEGDAEPGREDELDADAGDQPARAEDAGGDGSGGGPDAGSSGAGSSEGADEGSEGSGEWDSGDASSLGDGGEAGREDGGLERDDVNPGEAVSEGGDRAGEQSSQADDADAHSLESDPNPEDGGDGDRADSPFDGGSEAGAKDAGGDRAGDRGAGEEGGAGDGSAEEEGSLEDVDPLDYQPEAEAAVDATDQESRKFYQPPPPSGNQDDEYTLVDLGMHPEADGDLDGELIDALEKAIVQSMYFEAPSSNITGLKVWKYADREQDAAERSYHAWGGPYADNKQLNPDIEPVGEDVLGPALMRMRVAFSDNKRGRFDRNRRSGRIDTRALGKRAPFGDDRMFGKKIHPKSKDYFVLIMLDVSGSTRGKNIKMIKEAALAQAEMCDRMGIKFAIYGHCGAPISDRAFEDDSWGYSTPTMWVDQYEVKSPDQPWDNNSRAALMDLCPSAYNLDGHTLEFARKILDGRTETDRVLLYYSDGAMPAENHDEELEILQREIALCKAKGYTLLGVGVRTDSPSRHGMDTVQIDDSAEVGKVVTHLERVLIV